MASVTIAAMSAPATMALPPVDASLPDLLISSDVPAWFSLGSDAGPNVPGCYQVQPDSAVVIKGIGANATTATVLAIVPGWPVTVQRINAAHGIYVYPLRVLP